MIRRKRILLITAAIPVVLVSLIFLTAHYGSDHSGLHYISRPPVASVSWGPAERYIVQQGINTVWDNGTGAAGNVVEFPVSSHTRLSMTLFSFRWLHEEFEGWASDHQRIARWLGWNPCPERPEQRTETGQGGTT